MKTCKFCQTTKNLKRACPMCGGTSHLPVTPATFAPDAVRIPCASTVGPKPKTAQRVTPMDAQPRPAFAREIVLAKIRESYAAKDLNVAAALMVGLVGGTWAQGAVVQLEEIDRRSAARGWISKADEDARALITGECIYRLGFDPRTQTAPVARPAQTPAPKRQDVRPVIAAVAKDVAPVSPAELFAAPQLGDGQLIAGDWRGLWMMVQKGQLTEAQAREFGRIWMEQGK